MSEAGRASGERAGRFGWLRRIDDAVFAVEQAVVATFLIAMTVMVFLDVVYRRLAAPDSKIGELMAGIAGIEDEGTRTFIDAHMAPWTSVVLGLLILWFGFWTAERHRERPLLPLFRSIAARATALALATAAALGALGFLMMHPAVESRIFYLLLFYLALAGFVVSLLRRKPPGYRVRLAGLVLVVAPLFTGLAWSYFPRGYSWSKEAALIMILWVGFLGASICAHEGKHLRMEAFDKLLPPAIARYIHALGFLATAAFCVFMAVLGYEYVFDPMLGAVARGGVFEQTQIPDWVATVAVPLAFALTAARFIAAAVSILGGGQYGRPVSEVESEAESYGEEVPGHEGKAS
jgi:TRAP-type C4-dicarboxylate transport system permease small subunit